MRWKTLTSRCSKFIQKLCAKFHHNCPSFVGDITKNILVFFGPDSVYSICSHLIMTVHYLLTNTHMTNRTKLNQMKFTTHKSTQNHFAMNQTAIVFIIRQEIRSMEHVSAQCCCIPYTVIEIFYCNRMSSKVKGHGANQQPMGGFLSDLP